MEAELTAYERCRILRARLKALNTNTSMIIDDRLREIRRAEKALMLATRDLEQEDRVRDKANRASKPIPSEAELAAQRWQSGYARETGK